MNKIVRSICYFAKNPTNDVTNKLDLLAKKLENAGYEIQTRRLCSPISVKQLEVFGENVTLLNVGTLSKDQVQSQLTDFLACKFDLNFNVELCGPEKIDGYLVNLLFEIMKRNAPKTFNFTYVFSNRHSSPFFPSAAYYQDGFSIGLQSTDLAEKCETLDEWLNKMRDCWLEINQMFEADSEFLGIDSSLAPLFSGKSSFINFVNQLHPMQFPFTTTTDFYLKITKFIKTQNPKPVGLCGIMFPCIEDFELAEAYEEGDFSIERNVFLSLHSGLGVDVYPIGINEEKERVEEILYLLKGLAEKYNKPLAARFVSDGKAKCGQRADFKNQYLKDVVVNPL